jgi:hypothetical protein
LETERDALEERFAFGKISEELFNKFQSKIEAGMLKLRKINEDSQIKISDRQINSLFRLSVELSKSSEVSKKNSSLKIAKNPIQCT